MAGKISYFLSVKTSWANYKKWYNIYMAEKKESSSSLSFESFEIIFFIALAIGVIGFIVNLITKNQAVLSSFFNSLISSLINIYARYVIFSIFLSAALFVLVVIYIIKENKIKRKIMERVLPTGVQTKIKLEDAIVENPKWKIVEEHINSNDASKWKLAILEADIILNDLLESLHLPGESIGDKLKVIEPSDFVHLDQAWEAHKIRNAIAHQGSDFLLTQREAKRVIKLYELVFEEFKII